MSYQSFNKNTNAFGRRKKNSGNFLIPLFLLVIVFCLIFFTRTFFIDILSSVGLLTKNIQNSTVSKTFLLEENQRLQFELDRYLLGSVTQDFLLEENARLKGYYIDPNDVLLLSAVSVNPPLSPYGSLIIDKGSRAGVGLGDQVLAFGNMALGTVSKTAQNSSVVHLYSAAKRETIASLAEMPIRLQGQGGGIFKAEIPRDAEVSVGDIVRLPVIRLSVLGVVVGVIRDPQDPVTTIMVQSPINPQTIDYVEIRANSANTAETFSEEDILETFSNEISDQVINDSTVQQNTENNEQD